MRLTLAETSLESDLLIEVDLESVDDPLKERENVLDDVNVTVPRDDENERERYREVDRVGVVVAVR